MAGNGQITTDSVVMRYLRSVPDIPTPTLKISKKKNKTLREANFFIEEMDSVFYENTMLNTFIFGSSASHTRRYFLIQALSGNKLDYFIIDSPKLESGINELFRVVQQWNLSDTKKAILVRELIYIYN